MTGNVFSQTVMATQTTDSLAANEMHPLKLRSLYSSDNKNFVVGDFMANGKVQLQSTGKKMKNESLAGLELEVTKNDNGQKGDGVRTTWY